jgi:hypothetical protein
LEQIKDGFGPMALGEEDSPHDLGTKSLGKRSTRIEFYEENVELRSIFFQLVILMTPGKWTQDLNKHNSIQSLIEFSHHGRKGGTAQ